MIPTTSLPLPAPPRIADLPTSSPAPPSAARRWRSGIANVDGVVFPSAFAEHALRREVALREGLPTIVCPNFVDDAWTRGRRADPANAARDLITIGRLAPEKYQVFGIHLVAMLRDLGRPTTLTVVGSGDQLPMLEDHASRLGVTDLVEFVGGTTEIVDLLVAHRAYLHTSVIETFGITIVEAMAVGLPLLAAPEGAVRDLFTDGVEGRAIDLQSIHSSVDIARELLGDPASLTTMGAAGRRSFETRWSAEVTVGRLSRFLSSLVL